ncbi:TorD/DmsD family molecular chaperone [uncultured Clostridium sp.]|uniref:TorD/DmsD family molecular chaperone n=1 Tax=uncultured Clostridium sp. TaxID=59620 RepID=UPI00267350B2|nr:molecular chaperone TorD family protein [uncultured Clostridium sp.]
MYYLPKKEQLINLQINANRSGMMEEREFLQAFMEYRCGIYYWLKNLYISEPTKEQLIEIINTCREQKLDNTIPVCEGEFVNFFKGIDKRSINKLHKEIKVEYARLFLGPKHVPAPPFESVYRTKTRHMFGETTTEVRKLYKNAGLKIEAKDNLPDDFIGYELEFMYYLSFEALRALNEGDEVVLDKVIKYQYHFIKEHLNTWIKDFTKDIFENTTMEYFKVVANLTNEFIKDDYNNIENLI